MRNPALLNLCIKRDRFLKSLFIGIGICFSLSALTAQDTLRLMQYNLLKFGVPEASCTNPVSDKIDRLNVILPAVAPDILGVNEMGTSPLYADNILQNVLKDINPAYQRAEYTNESGADLTNMLFYNSEKLTMYREEALDHFLRDINFYTLYYNGSGLATGDTTFINVVLVHLKAGSGSSDENTRLGQANQLMGYLNSLGEADNFFVMGDFNVQSSTDDAYVAMTTHSNTTIRQKDPLSAPGTWTSNSSFADIHTQSPRCSSLSDCGSTGGMDDRFDFILGNDLALNGGAGISYISGSYKAYGNDGAHYNDCINAGGNSAVSTAIANALYSCSDHLPVLMDIETDQSFVGLDNEFQSNVGFRASVLGNPVVDQVVLLVELHELIDPVLKIELTDLQGRSIQQWEEVIVAKNASLNLDISNVSSGAYFLSIRQENGNQWHQIITKR